jgi:phage terminase large subunit
MSNIIYPHNATDIFHKNLAALLDPLIHTIVNEGGTSSSKTYSIIQLLSYWCQLVTIPFLVSITSESFPHLEAGAIRDFKNIMAPIWDESKWNETKHFYEFGEHVILEFFASDNPGKAHGPRRSVLYCNEVNNIPKPIVDAMLLRTRGKVFYDFNPVHQFWVHDLRGKSGIAWIHSTYLDAKMFLPQRTIERVENLRETDPNGWRIYGLGLVGKIEGLVYPNFLIVDEIPPVVHPVQICGIDFGYSIDPTVLVRNTIQGKKLYSEELIYEIGLTNRQIADRFAQVGIRKSRDLIVADSAEPKSIQELCDYGYNVIPVKKGQGSVEYGIQRVNQYIQHWTKPSTKCIKEQRNYMYVKDKDGKFTEKTTHYFSHGMDARRYAMSELSEVTGFPPASEWFGTKK